MKQPAPLTLFGEYPRGATAGKNFNEHIYRHQTKYRVSVYAGGTPSHPHPQPIRWGHSAVQH